MSREIKFRAWHNELEIMLPWEQMMFEKHENDDYITFYELEEGSSSIF